MTNIAAVWLPRFRRLGRELLWIAAGQSMAAFGGLVGVRLLTQSLGPDLYGELALGLTVVGLVHQLLMGPLQLGALRFYGPARDAGETNAYLRALRILLFRGSLIVTGILALVITILGVTGLWNWVGFATIAALLALVSGYERILDAIQMAARQRAITAWHQALGQWLRFLLAVALVALLGASGIVAMIGYAVATCLVLLSQFVFFRRKIAPLVATEMSAHILAANDWARRIQAYAWPFATWGLFSWGQQSSDRWALQVVGGTESVGYYSVLYQVGFTPVTMLSGVVVQLIQPILYREVGDAADPARVRRARQLNVMAIIGFLSLTVFGVVLALALHAQVFAILTAPAYRAVSGYLPWMVLAAGLFATGQVATLLVLSGTDTRALIGPQIVAAISGIVLNFVSARLFGLSGVVYASVVSSAIFLMWILLLSRSTISKR